MRIASYLSDHEVAFNALLHPPAYTASRRAHYLRVPGKLFAKSVLLHGPAGYFLAVLPATHSVDLSAASAFAGGPVRLAGRQEIPEVFRDCEWGALAPFGSLYGVPTLLDDSFDPDAMLVFAAQQHGLAIRMRCRDFERLELPRRLRIASEPRASASREC
jgi:Ala-tRNA(Pro) deacylase